MLRTARLFFYSVRYTKPQQLIYRVLLLTKRKLLERLATAKFKSDTAIATDNTTTLRHALPAPLFSPRSHLVIDYVTTTRVRFLNTERDITLPLQWRPKDLQIGTRLWLLNLHYMEFLEGLDDSKCAAYILDWIHHNLPYEKGYWLDNWNSFSLSIRIVVWMQQIAAREFTAINSSQQQLVLRSLVAQTRFLRSNIELDIGGNHILKNIKALLWAGRFFEGPEADSWREYGVELLAAQLDEQILNDGMHYELSPAYHAQVFADLLECYSVLDPSKIRNTLHQNLNKMAQNLVDLTHPDGKCSLFNDGGLNMAYSTDECIAVYAQLIGEKVEPRQQMSYPDAGYFGLRMSDEFFLADFGPLGPDYLPAHGHGDMFSFEWSIGKTRVVIDPGVFEYNSGLLRSLSRSTTMHNTVSIDDADQSEFWKAFRVGRRARIIDRNVQWDNQSLFISGTHNGYSRLLGKPLHRRTFNIMPGDIKIDDEIINGNGQNATARLMLHPDWRIESSSSHHVICRCNDLLIKIHSSGEMKSDLVQCFLDFGCSEPTIQLTISFGKIPLRGKIELTRL